MNWTKYLMDTLTADSELDEFRILPGGAAEGVIENKPFIMVKMGAVNPEMEGDMRAYAESTNGEIWVHDNPGSFKRIDDTLSHLRNSLSGPVPSATGGIACTWQGNSPELSDSGFGTITRYISFRMTGAI